MNINNQSKKIGRNSWSSLNFEGIKLSILSMSSSQKEQMKKLIIMLVCCIHDNLPCVVLVEHNNNVIAKYIDSDGFTPTIEQGNTYNNYEPFRTAITAEVKPYFQFFPLAPQVNSLVKLNAAKRASYGRYMESDNSAYHLGVNRLLRMCSDENCDWVIDIEKKGVQNAYLQITKCKLQHNHTSLTSKRFNLFSMRELLGKLMNQCTQKNSTGIINVIKSTIEIVQSNKKITVLYEHGIGSAANSSKINASNTTEGKDKIKNIIFCNI